MNLLLEAAAASSSAANLNCASTAAATSGWLGTTDWGRWGAVGWKPVSSAYQSTRYVTITITSASPMVLSSPSATDCWISFSDSKEYLNKTMKSFSSKRTGPFCYQVFSFHYATIHAKISIMQLREDTHKKVFFLVVGPLRGGGH